MQNRDINLFTALGLGGEGLKRFEFFGGSVRLPRFGKRSYKTT